MLKYSLSRNVEVIESEIMKKFHVFQLFSRSMCRAFYLIALTVATNYVLECSAVPAGIKHRRSHGLLPIADAQQQQRNAVDPNDVELVDPIETSSTVNMTRATSRNQLFDNIFKVRIQLCSQFSLFLVHIV